MEWKRRLAIVGIVVGVYVGYAYLLPAAVPFLAAWLLAVWLYPAAVKIQKKTKLKKSAAGAVLLLLVFGGAGFLLYLGVRELFAQFGEALSNFPEWLAQGGRLMKRLCLFLEETFGIPQETGSAYLAAALSRVEEKLPALGLEVLDGVSRVFGGALVFLSGAGVTFILAVLILGDMENLRKKIWDYSWLVGTRRVVKRLKKTTAVYLKAQVVIMALVAAVSSLWFRLLQSPYFLIQGLILGGLDALPLVGTGSFLYPAAVYYLFQGRPQMAAGCVVLDIITSFLREFLEPKLLGGNLGISPIAVLASVYIGIFLFGVWGVILGPLSFSTAYEIGREWDVWG